jgi:hypothetical protein
MLIAKLNSNIRRLGMYALVAVLAFSAGFATLAHATSPITFYACQSIGLKSLYNVVTSPSMPLECKRGDVAVQWDQVGPMGPQGVQGPAGATGLQGLKGDTGLQGPQGEKGDTGPQGALGPVGAQGNPGPQGTSGQPGSVGPQGEQGPAGPGIDRSHVYQNRSGFVVINFGPATEAYVGCNDANDILLSGGYWTSHADIHVYSSYQRYTASVIPQEWVVFVTSLGAPGDVEVYVTCLQVD